MIGYHYTTYEAYLKIKEAGLEPRPLIKDEWDTELKNLVRNGCIWVYVESLIDRELIGQLMYVAVNHRSHHLVCLEVEYWEQESVYIQTTLALEPEDKLYLTHDLGGIGVFNHTKAPYDLILSRISPERIHLVGEWNLLDWVHEGERQVVA